MTEKPQKRYKVSVLVVPTNLEISLGAKVTRGTRLIYGTNLADAKKRAGIQ